IIYAKTIVVASTGSVQANGTGGSYCGTMNAAGTPGTGGGSVNVFYQNTLTNSGSIVANGGGGAGGECCYGEAGGAGTVRNPKSNPYQLPSISINTPYNVNEQTANIDVTISDDYGKGNSTILLEWGNDMIGNYTYSTSLTNKGIGTYTMTMDKLDQLPQSKTYYRITVTNSEGGSSPAIGNFQVQKSLLTGVRSLNGTGSGDKSIATAYATIPIEYVEVNGSTHYTASTSLGNATADASMLAVRYNGDVLIDAGVTLTPAARKRGMFMYVDGALTVNGAISMTTKGASGVAGDRILVLTESGTSYEIPAAGISGGNGQTGKGGNRPAGGCCGYASGYNGTSYSGGIGYPGTCGGTFYGGGLLIIYAKTIVVASTGSVQANGTGGSYCGTMNAAGTPGTGGGSVNIFYQNTLTNSGSIVANGGGGAGGECCYGEAGGAGTVRSIKVSN
ncbi:MAG: hypothetical protein PHW52_05245, partial [Candidatus Pacebacteria bacterium]|nr:hypothetical protein [Candidatus Paceibacterota bacterium]